MINVEFKLLSLFLWSLITPQCFCTRRHSQGLTPDAHTFWVWKCTGKRRKHRKRYGEEFRSRGLGFRGLLVFELGFRFTVGSGKCCTQSMYVYMLIAIVLPNPGKAPLLIEGVLRKDWFGPSRLNSSQSRQVKKSQEESSHGLSWFMKKGPFTCLSLHSSYTYYSFKKSCKKTKPSGINPILLGRGSPNAAPSVSPPLCC